MKILPIVALLATSCVPLLPVVHDPTKDPPRVDVRYDKFKDQTEVSSNLVRVKGGLLNGVALAGGYICKGNYNCHPSKYALYIYSSSEDWHYLRDHHLIVLVTNVSDQQRIDLGETEMQSEVHSGFVTEMMVAEVPMRDFEKIASSTKLEFQLGQDEFEIPAAGKMALSMVLDHSNTNLTAPTPIP
jgi:hypothetical protein